MLAVRRGRECGRGSPGCASAEGAALQSRFMAKIKPAGSKKKPAGPQTPGAIPCLILVVLGFAILGFILYFSISRAG